MNLAKVRVSDVGIYLSGADVGVAEHSLNGTEIGAVHEKVGRKRMAQGVGRNMLGDAGFFGIVLDDAFNTARSKAAIIT